MIQMLRDRILVKPQVRALSDVLVVENTEKLNWGHIVSIGPDVEEVAVGDEIRYGNGTYLDYQFWTGPDGVKYQILQEADVACVVEH